MSRKQVPFIIIGVMVGLAVRQLEPPSWWWATTVFYVVCLVGSVAYFGGYLRLPMRWRRRARSR